MEKIIDGKLSVKCSNGRFLGISEDSVLSFKGIPYAKAPTGELRWKPPIDIEDSEEVFEAYTYGKSPIQTEWPSELGSYHIKGEDCLKLNVWTSEEGRNKTVMVFFHGGSYGWGGTSDPLYDGHNFVKAHPEIVMVTVGFRTGIMGFLDLTEVPGGESYKESGNLGLLDMVCALRWVNKNISCFGGNPENVTIFGESSGGGAVSLIPLMENTKGLFNRVIAQSGSIALTYSKDECMHLTRRLLKEANASTMDELLALSEEELIVINEELNDYNNFPERDGIVLPEEPYDEYKKGKAAHIDMLIGSNKDEMRYWITEIGYSVPFSLGILGYKIYSPILFESKRKTFSKEDKKAVHEFMKLQKDNHFWRITEFFNEVLFRVPALFQAESISNNGGRAFVYYWDYPSAHKDIGASHAVELAYVFNNLKETLYTGDNIDPELAKIVQQMWVNFAQTGDPSTKEHEWPEYNKETRTSMILGRNIRPENDWLRNQRLTIEPILKYHINGQMVDTDLNIPSVYFYGSLAVGAVIGGIALIRKLIK